MNTNKYIYNESNKILYHSQNYTERYNTSLNDIQITRESENLSKWNKDS